MLLVFQEALTVLLGRIVDSGDTVQKLQQFVTDVMDTGSATYVASSRTYEAFAAALSSYMQRLTHDLTQLESTVGKQG